MNTKKLYIILRSVMGLAFNMSFMATAIYRIDVANLEIYQLILVGSALEIAIFLFEVPTGVVADLKSRRLSIIIGLFIIGLGFFVEILTTFFLVIVLSQIIWGLGYTFISGALDSWISDETGNQNIEQTLISGAQMHKLFSVLGIVLAAVIGMFDIRLAIAFAGGLFIFMGLFAIALMNEEHFVKHPHHEPLWTLYFSQLGHALSHVRTNKVLKIMVVIMLFLGLYSEGIDRTHERYILNNLNMRDYFDIAPIWILSIINAIIAIIGYVVLHVVKKYITKGHHVVLWALNFTIMMIVGIVLFAFLPFEYIAVVSFMFFTINREATYPLLNTILIRSTPSRIKATVLSGFGQLDAIGQLLSGALMVGATFLVGIEGMYLFTALLLLVPALLFPMILRVKES
ncbi:MFS transporter [Candidatus Xianfuyuplasma coldseepsis]|uniref:MFS transporter n=1 Tax=Candidatus Xianfuyuplasma coldseepsis TaxID=2782163 RepID=A0A7L7KPH0_9MOLU|nr:MFS transporter [Xianfuyuplasma coldseepsis]QMS84680.1 MFS transporter [Xianfuyuplasma coldseepsis]